MVICKICYMHPIRQVEAFYDIESCEIKDVLNEFMLFCQINHLGYPEIISAKFYSVSPDRKSQICLVDKEN